MATKRERDKAKKEGAKRVANKHFYDARKATERKTVKKIKFTAIWRDGTKKEYEVKNFKCSLFLNTSHDSYYVTFDDGYTFVCDAIEVVIQ